LCGIYSETDRNEKLYRKNIPVYKMKFFDKYDRSG